jgi:signal transduction histidine kinase
MNYLSAALWHELRTPLASLEGNVVILEEEVKDQFLRDISYKMEQQINRIETTLDNLRQLTSIFQEENQFSTAEKLKRTLEEVINNFEDDIQD